MANRKPLRIVIVKENHVWFVNHPRIAAVLVAACAILLTIAGPK